MPKMKTNRAAAKRFKKTGGGHLKRGRCGHRHGMISKNRTQNRRLRQTTLVHKDHEKRIKALLPYA
jgi:large subunit ribosomal protein L35